MENQNIDQVVQFLNTLFDPNLSLHSVSFIFDNISVILRRMNLTVKIIESKHFYLDPELHFIYLKKKMAFDKLDFQEAAAYRQREITLLAEKGENENTMLRTFPEVSFFEHEDYSIIAHLSKSRTTDRLLINLIEAYKLACKK